GVLYSDSPASRAKAQGVLFYGCSVKSTFWRNFNRYRHLLTPWAKYEGYSDPLVAADHVYIFSIADGFHRLDLVKVGLKNTLISLKPQKFLPTFEIDLYSQAFLRKEVRLISFPKGYVDFRWSLPSFSVLNQNCWNIEYKVLDYSKLRLGWTASSALAIAFEYRYRSQYAWRKAMEDNFILDAAREVSALLDSSVSDRRNTILTHAYWKINSYLSLEAQSRHGFKRQGEPAYNACQIDLFFLLSSAWKIKLSYQYTKSDPYRITFDYYLLKL
ncbi:MAG: hypothetical protein WC371_05470, partial [Parachlamydiales bacterium]